MEMIYIWLIEEFGVWNTFGHSDSITLLGVVEDSFDFGIPPTGKSEIQSVISRNIIHTVYKTRLTGTCILTKCV